MNHQVYEGIVVKNEALTIPARIVQVVEPFLADSPSAAHNRVLVEFMREHAEFEPGQVEVIVRLFRPSL